MHALEDQYSRKTINEVRPVNVYAGKKPGRRVGHPSTNGQKERSIVSVEPFSPVPTAYAAINRMFVPSAETVRML